MNSRQEQLLHAYHAISEELTSLTGLKELLDRILRISREVFHFDNAVIRLLRADGQALEVAASYGYSDCAVLGPLRLEQGIMGQVARSGRPMLVTDVRHCAAYYPGIPGACCALTVPMLAHDRLVGVFNVESTRPAAFAPEDIEPLMTVATQAAVAIENIRLLERERQLARRYQKLCEFNDRIIQSVNLGIYTLDTDLRVTSWNRRMEALSGCSAAEVLHQPLLELFPVLIQEGFDCRLQQVLQTRQAEKLQLVHYNLRGERRVQKRKLAPLLDGDQLLGLVVIVEDITEFKGLLDQMIQSEKLAEVGRLAAGIAHEINNPLTVLGYCAEVLERDDPLPAQCEYLARIRSEVERLQHLTGGLLGFARAGQGQRQRLALAPLCDQVLSLLDYRLQRGRIALQRHYGVIAPVWGDVNPLKQLLMNLLVNAVQAMPDGGRLGVHLRSRRGGVELVVCDSGAGIAHAQLERIFDPFFTTKKEGEGTGLGLYLCRQIARDHGGRLWLRSRVGRGSQFHLWLPAAEEDMSPCA